MSEQDPVSPISSNQTPLHQHMQGEKSIIEKISGYFLSYFDKPNEKIADMLYKVQNIAETNFQIAQTMSDTGNFKDAVWRLKIALWLAPDYQQAHYLAGCCYVSLQNVEKGAYHLQRAVELNPQHEAAVFMLAALNPAALDPAMMPRTMPQEMSHEYFTNNAANYENMQSDSGYKGHQLADMALWDMLDPRRVNYEILELGSGTGLCGTLLAQRADRLVGVDFCKDMLDIGKTKRRPDGRRIYTESILQDVRYFMIDSLYPEYDAIVAAHVFNYIGDISYIFEGAARALREGGAFIFQVELYDGADGYGLLKGLGRFGHSDAYIHAECERVGLKVVESNLVNVYPDYEMRQYSIKKPWHQPQ
jgi:predicted TPR repeat methyltransferase